MKSVAIMSGGLSSRVLSITARWPCGARSPCRRRSAAGTSGTPCRPLEQITTS
ncbi:hypothetical protein BC477_09135 [Clavibacter michiganensis subsp. michiganensis]|uniref:Uncharacterized protein n=1 Tax=Clavibacter michiganensis subsp. michiganensis TaxID=33013 RepID=A0A251XPA8_CLAMM|nr:hypothetical protein BC477_09135 [Clavibacter michiganensis subsp. michiganensis]OUE04888.1 hypothetical protein CMMCAS07_08060 [Clavibacter michiganensis subsp. michiganensis]